MIAFGPIPSRRLGQSLGINNIPPKVCTYDCVYCQVGPTTDSVVQRRKFYTTEEIYKAVKQKVEEVKKAGGKIDYLSIVPDGEPTLDIHLADYIAALKPLGIKIAVISNSSLLWREEVRKDLMQADLVSLKIDGVEEASWRKVNRPHKELVLADILEGILAFAKMFRGEIITETMLVKGINDGEENLRRTAAFLKKLDPAVAYIGIATRPPSEKWVEAPDEETLVKAHQIYSENVKQVELLTGFSPDSFVAAGEDPAQNILDITSVHPMRESEVMDFLKDSGADKSLLEKLLREEKLVQIQHDGMSFYIRKLANTG